ncbi:MAG TPA: hypothetical protein VK709_20535 [Candidatus Saccharimonadales bacterium]|jgi:hypothetical protein|nr:hypothetical protein [Candidatus Saccharimonadales bacterium]
MEFHKLGITVEAESNVLGNSICKERGAVKFLSFFVLSVALLGLASCGAAPTSTAITCTTSTSTTATNSSTNTCTDPVTSISVTISPATVSVNVATPQQFQDSIQGGTNNVTIWKVNSITSGNDTVGRIDANGLYHAPTTIPSPPTVTVTAVSFEDQNVSASATVAVTPAPAVTITSPSAPVTISAGSANPVNFSATETGGSTEIILWYVGPVGGLGVLGGNSTFGTISASGVYTPPLAPPIGQTVTVTAAAQDSPTSTATLAVTIAGYSISSLQGRYTFSLTGNNASGHFFRAGSFVADGAGGLNTVIEDVNTSASVTSSPIITTGTYTVGPDGRGTLKLNDGLTPANFNFVIVNGTQLQLIAVDSAETAIGQANAQNAGAFQNIPLSALSGTYIFDFSGVDGSKGLSQIGEFSADGAGHVTNGLININDGGTLNQYLIDGTRATILTCPNPSSSLSSYTVSSNGRGTLTLTTCAGGPTLTLTFYVTSAGSAKFIGTDTVKQVAGFTSTQDPNASFNTAALNGGYTFLLSGTATGGPIATVGNFVADGNGNVTSGELDENLNGVATSNVFQTTGTSAGTYTVNPNGQGTLTFKTAARTYTLVFYLGEVGSGSTAVVQETDAGITSDGNFNFQQGAPFTLSSLVGNYAMETSGVSSSAFQVSSGQFGSNGAGTIVSGGIDSNTGGTTLTLGQAVSGTYSAPAATGRVTLTLTAGALNYVGYIVSPTQVYILGIQPGELAEGTLLRQF